MALEAILAQQRADGLVEVRRCGQRTLGRQRPGQRQQQSGARRKGQRTASPRNTPKNAKEKVPARGRFMKSARCARLPEFGNLRGTWRIASPCPNGATAQSPTLPRSGYLGYDGHTTFYPNGVEPRKGQTSHNPVGVMPFFRHADPG